LPHLFATTGTRSNVARRHGLALRMASSVCWHSPVLRIDSRIPNSSTRSLMQHPQPPLWATPLGTAPTGIISLTTTEVRPSAPHLTWRP